jgi:hypothetical protein
MNKKVNFDELEKYLAAKGKIRTSYRYFNASDHSRTVYDNAVEMGENILAERADGRIEPQPMVDLAVQALYNAEKALDGRKEKPAPLASQVERLGQFFLSQEFAGLPYQKQEEWRQVLKKAKQLRDAQPADTAAQHDLASQIAAKLDSLQAEPIVKEKPHNVQPTTTTTAKATSAAGQFKPSTAPAPTVTTAPYEKTSPAKKQVKPSSPTQATDKERPKKKKYAHPILNGLRLALGLGGKPKEKKKDK